MKIISILMFACVFGVLTGCVSSKKVPYTPLDFPRYEWSFSQNGEVYVKYDINEEGRADNVRVIDAQPSMLFNSYIKRKILEDWRFEKNAPKKDVSVKVKFKH